ncbi:nuclear transport factor 2 family protein [Rhodococcus sp. HNM0563]|uniref:nuclear transport factor 2 family protein n=1 Tax=unclassified Rhodococcus (in: high G+C Gram-positive bacteria) TaxID=192944 RepID=UPI00146F6ED1|nr:MULTISPECIES: nuclear transport factor 2 family protein [unclassified Rhodococcus (in: high G+C Gram-positive bacteria)]MCK0089390.1 nuclear transport factor 2 family protein [Rhodococcus sp. F64268]NLU62916.1 nuclear transport factor 2 family protein [Rhodococcus sp. HNM0563]
MSTFDRAELDEMISRWIDANKRAEEAGDWKPLAEMYTEDATYGWNYGPKDDFMAVGRDEIREFALGQEMRGLEGWEYPYQQLIVDDRSGDVIGMWKQIADAKRDNGERYSVHGIGGSWFRYGGNFQWSWQRDFFDFGNVSHLFLEMITDGALSDGMNKRIERSTSGKRLPGWYPAGQAPVSLW